ncbi:hypothetical protein [Vandammella animalimorsus]|uniref:hypothetical protein n=1 Tax=Vandammella animalimorsus TaxID=2029117 RepID=UPI0015552F3C|nr:hypothetical protein [Vandammella animalimorsus]
MKHRLLWAAALLLPATLAAQSLPAPPHDAQTTPQTATQTAAQTADQTLAAHLPSQAQRVQVYASTHWFFAAQPYDHHTLRGIVRGWLQDRALYRALDDAAQVQASMAHLRAVRVRTDAEAQPGQTGRAAQTGQSPCLINPMMLWDITDRQGALTSLALPMPAQKPSSMDSSDPFTPACLERGGQAYALEVNRADVWQAIEPLLKPPR